MSKHLNIKVSKGAVNELAAQSIQLMEGMGRFFDRNIDLGQLHPPQFRLLQVLSRLEGQVPMSRLARELGVTAGTLTTSSKKLIAKGVLTRLRSAEDDRVVLVQLTASGRRILANHQQQHRAVFAEMLGNLSPAKQKKFIEVHGIFLSLIQEAIRAEDQTGGAQ